MPKKATPQQDGKTWSMRRRVLGQDFYVSGKTSKTAAATAMEELVSAQKLLGTPKGLGPADTTVAQALQDMGMERLKFRKGAVQDANRFNRYLRIAGLSSLNVTPWESSPQAYPGADEKEVRSQDFKVELEKPSTERRVPRGLVSHRRQLAQSSARSENIRAHLAGMAMAEVQTHHVQSLMDALRSEGNKPATLQQERALLRGLFNYARVNWHWAAPAKNPGIALMMPPVDNGRVRVMSRDEQARLDEAVQDCRNGLIGPTLTLLTETAMRASEPLARLRWCDVDWDAKLLTLHEAKAGGRQVGLSRLALEALQTLRGLTGGAPGDKVVGITYEALSAAWVRACGRAGIQNLHIQDLRHTAATRMALSSGNVFLVKALTGHKTMEMVQRYVNVGASDVVEFLHRPVKVEAQAESQTSAVATPPISVSQPPQRQAAVAGDAVSPVQQHTPRIGEPQADGPRELSSGSTSGAVTAAVTEVVAVRQRRQTQPRLQGAVLARRPAPGQAAPCPRPAAPQRNPADAAPRQLKARVFLRVRAVVER